MKSFLENHSSLSGSVFMKLTYFSFVFYFWIYLLKLMVRTSLKTISFNLFILIWWHTNKPSMLSIYRIQKRIFMILVYQRISHPRFSVAVSTLDVDLCSLRKRNTLLCWCYIWLSISLSMLLSPYYMRIPRYVTNMIILSILQILVKPNVPRTDCCLGHFKLIWDLCLVHCK